MSCRPTAARANDVQRSRAAGRRADANVRPRIGAASYATHMRRGASRACMNPGSAGARLSSSTVAVARRTVLHRFCNRRNQVLQVFVRDNNVDQALRVLKRRLQREGVFREMKRKRFYEKPSERLARERSEAIRRIRKLKRKQAQREGLLPAPKKKPAPVRGAGADAGGGRGFRPPRP